jgi:DNA polymerase (family X)
MFGNREVAAVLDDIGDMLEIVGETIFRVRAYHRAAESVRGAPEDINDLAAQGRLTDLPAVGAGVAERIEELLQTGKMAYFENLKEQVPPRVLELMRVPGLGPRKAKQLYDELHLTSLDELLDAARSEKIRTLKGMSAKTEANIVAGIELLRAGQERMTLAEAYPLANKFVERLRQDPGVTAADFAGSLRRMKESIGDIDILAAAADPGAVARKFSEAPEVVRVLALGDTKASVLTRSGLQIDLRVLRPADYGSALQYFTGSREHNIRLRDLAKRRGLRVSEYGLFDVKSDQRLGGATEGEIYSLLGLDYIEPEMREDHGELDAARDHALPKSIVLGDVKGDLQAHSSWSDGLSSVAEMAETARGLGYEYLALTDHAEKLKIAGGMTREDIAARRREIEKVNEQVTGITVLNAVELNIDGDGNVDYEPDILRQFALTLGSIHSGFGQPREKIMSRLRRAAQNPYIHIIAHPTGRIIGKRNPYAVDIEELFDLAASTGTILEINAFPDRLDLKDDYIREARRRGLKMSLGTDAHMASQLSYMIYGVATARRGWLEASDVVNTRPLKEMLSLLKDGT